jgi:hypothetical protein
MRLGKLEEMWNPMTGLYVALVAAVGLLLVMAVYAFS